MNRFVLVLEAKPTIRARERERRRGRKGRSLGEVLRNVSAMDEENEAGHWTVPLPAPARVPVSARRSAGNGIQKL